MRGRLASALALSALSVMIAGCAASAPELPPPPKVAPLSSSESEAIYTQTVASYAEHLQTSFPGVQLPEVERVRFIAPQEFADVFATCMSEAGFGAVVSDDNGIKLDPVPDEQAEAQSVALYVCRAQYPTDSKYQRSFTAEQLQWLYEYTQLRLIPCLDEEGITPDKLPSKSVFAETFGSEGAWNPYADVPADKITDVSKKCPAVPASFWG